MVLAEITTAWHRALARAEARGIEARQTGSGMRGDVTTTWYRVGSWSRPETMHGVKVTASANGVEAECSCEAGINGNVCQHMAAALKAAGWLGEDAPVVTQPKRRSSLLAWQDEDEADVRAAWGESPAFADLVMPE